MVAVKDVSKRYGSTVALKSVSLQLKPSQVHGIVGGNGAGKSTLMRILVGLEGPDSGSVDLAGARVAMVHQHSSLVPAFTAEENWQLMHAKSWILDRSAPEIALNEALWKLPLNVPVGSLSVGVRQRLEIVLALAANPDVLVLDEPTSNLSADETSELFELIRGQRQNGRTVVLIAHKLADVLAIADEITVLRQGELVGTVLAAESSASELAKMMLGELQVDGTRPLTELGLPVVRAENLTVSGDDGRVRVAGVSFEIRAGEIFGIGGVDGNGQTELAEALAGVRPHSGRVERPENTGYVPADRHTDGVALELSVADNLTANLARRPDLKSGMWRKRAAIDEWTQSAIVKHGIKTKGPNERAGALSGGNQQKVVVGRVAGQNPEFLVAVNPTQGLDFAAAAAVHAEIRALAGRGVPVLLISTDDEEIDALSTTRAFLFNGQLNTDRAQMFGGNP